MSKENEAKLLTHSMKELNKTIEQTLAKDTGLMGKAQKFNTFSTPVLKSIIYGITGLGLGTVFAALSSNYLGVNQLLLSSSLSVLFSTLGIVTSLYITKGGSSSVKYDTALQENEREISRLKNVIIELTEMNAPKEIVSNRWMDLETLERHRLAIVKAKSKNHYKRFFKGDTKYLDAEIEKSEREQGYSTLTLIDDSNNIENELEKTNLEN